VTIRRGGRPAAGEPDVFGALADPTRRLLLERLSAGERTVSDLTAGLAISQAAVSQHLRLLRDTGLVRARVDGRHRVYRLRPDGLLALRRWLESLDRFWAARVAALDAYLEEEPG
jgi:DNA-binding transcriptional ArsR family regulator